MFCSEKRYVAKEDKVRNEIEIEQEVYGWASKFYWLNKTHDELSAVPGREADCAFLMKSMTECVNELRKLGYGVNGKPLFEVV